ncbi:hypothetical protein GGP41_003400 [Bipolaris sorokiniana]|uniref:Uncharacterized protein n=1 Tax=Cochliobolus sativus TaxID=45130 RepID=A0A8H5ZEB8_COCSA|nr:hypothetical protein GGP41_003400 [Bipolaris sorokiniana]
MQHIPNHDTDIAMNSRQTLFPLEMILGGFVDMIDQGKILAVEDSYDGEQEYLQGTLQAFEQLVDAIHAKMPSQPPQNAQQGLIGLVNGSNAKNLPSNSF